MTDNSAGFGWGEAERGLAERCRECSGSRSNRWTLSGPVGRDGYILTGGYCPCPVRARQLQ